MAPATDTLDVWIADRIRYVDGDFERDIGADVRRTVDDLAEWFDWTATAAVEGLVKVVSGARQSGLAEGETAGGG